MCFQDTTSLTYSQAEKTHLINFREQSPEKRTEAAAAVDSIRRSRSLRAPRVTLVWLLAGIEDAALDPGERGAAQRTVCPLAACGMEWIELEINM